MVRSVNMKNLALMSRKSFLGNVIVLTIIFLISSFTISDSKIINSQEESIQILGGGYSKGMFYQPSYIDIQNQRILIADTGLNRIQIFLRGNVFQSLFGSYGKNEIQFDRIQGICNLEQNIFVVDSGNSRIQVFDNKGGFINQFGTYGHEDGELYEPTDIETDGKNIYLLDTGNQRIQVFTLDGKFLNSFPKQDETKYNLQNPLGLTTGNGKLFVTDSFAKKVLVFDLNGKLWKELTPLQGKDTFSPMGICYSNNEIFVVDQICKRVIVWNEKLEEVRTISLDTMKKPFSINYLDGLLFVSDQETNRIETFKMDGIQKDPLGLKNPPVGKFVNPVSITTTENEIFVLDQAQNEILCFDEMGIYQSRIERTKMVEAGIRCPTKILYVGTNLWIIDQRSSKLVELDLKGTLLQTYWLKKEDSDLPESPVNFCFNNGEIFVVSDIVPMICVIELQKRKMTEIKLEIPDNIKFSASSISASNQLFFITNSLLGSIEVFDRKGKWIDHISGESNIQEGLSYPCAIIADANSNLVVCDKFHHRLVQINSSGQSMESFGGFGSVFTEKTNVANRERDLVFDIFPGSFVFPSDIVFFQSSLLVVDSFNQRIQKIPLTILYGVEDIVVSTSEIDFGMVAKADSELTKNLYVFTTGINRNKLDIKSSNQALTVEKIDSYPFSTYRIKLNQKDSELSKEKGSIILTLGTIEKKVSVTWRVEEKPLWKVNCPDLIHMDSASKEKKLELTITPLNEFNDKVDFSAESSDPNLNISLEKIRVFLSEETTIQIQITRKTNINYNSRLFSPLNLVIKSGDIRSLNSILLIQDIDPVLIFRNVLCELFTATWCGYCPSAERGYKTLNETKPSLPVSLLSYYVKCDDDKPLPRLSYPESEARRYYYSLSGYPTSFFDGVRMEIGGSQKKDYDMAYWYLEHINIRKEMKTPVQIKIDSFSYFPVRRTGELAITVKLTQDFMLKDPRIFCVLREDNIPFKAINLQKEHSFVVRDFLALANQTSKHEEGISLAKLKKEFKNSGDSVTISIPFTIEDFVNPKNVAFVVFVQDYLDKEVYQSLTFLPSQSQEFVSFSLIPLTPTERFIDSNVSNLTFDFLIKNDGSSRDVYDLWLPELPVICKNTKLTIDGIETSFEKVVKISLSSQNSSRIQLEFEVNSKDSIDRTDWIFTCKSKTSSGKGTLIFITKP